MFSVRCSCAHERIWSSSQQVMIVTLNVSLHLMHSASSEWWFAFYSSTPEIVSFYGVITKRITLQEDNGTKAKIQSLTAEKGLAPPPASLFTVLWTFADWVSVFISDVWQELSFSINIQMKALSRICGCVWPSRMLNVPVMWLTCMWICHVVRTYSVWSPELRFLSVTFNAKSPGQSLTLLISFWRHLD